MKYMWMAVTADKYELPKAVAETDPELAECLGVRVETIYTMEKDNRTKRIKNQGKCCGVRVYKILLEDMENDGTV